MKVGKCDFVNDEVQIQVIGEISDDEYNRFEHYFDFFEPLSNMDQAYEVAIRNGKDFITQMDPDAIRRRYFEEKVHAGEISANANRLIYNYCSTFGTFVNYAERAAKIAGKSDDFAEYLRLLFDKQIAYRFIYKLRNYCIHFSFPYDKLEASAPDQVFIYCTKHHLLDYDGWGKPVTKDLDAMGDRVNIYEMVRESLFCLKMIRNMLYIFFMSDINNAKAEISKLQSRFGTRYPIFAQVEKNGEDVSCTTYPIPLEKVERAQHIIDEIITEAKQHKATD